MRPPRLAPDHEAQGPTPPALRPLARIVCEVGPLVSLGATAAGERRYVPLLGGTVQGDGFSGSVIAGGVDWQLARADGALEIAAHYALRLDGIGAVVEVRSNGLRHGPPEVMARLARGEEVDAAEYFFRTLVVFTTGAPRWAHLNKVYGHRQRAPRGAACRARAVPDRLRAGLQQSPHPRYPPLCRFVTPSAVPSADSGWIAAAGGGNLVAGTNAPVATPGATEPRRPHPSTHLPLPP